MKSLTAITLVAVVTSLVTACGSPAVTNDAGTQADAGMTATDSGTQSDAGIDAGTDAGTDECAAALSAPSNATTTYFIAINDPGASNTACDGLAATAESATHCPFKDFSVTSTTRLLDQVKSKRVVVRAGTYFVKGSSGINVTGVGASAQERVELTTYPGETVILDNEDGTGAVCLQQADPTTSPLCVREVVRVSGNYTLVQGFTIRNGLAFQLEVTGGAHHIVRCNTFETTQDFSMRSDMVKLDNLADDILIRKNEFRRWKSQAIDMTGISNVRIEANEFHDPLDADGNAVGMKYGSRAVTISDNRVHDLGTDGRGNAFVAGGTGTPHTNDASAYDIHFINNRVWNISGFGARFSSCRGCSFENNDIADAGAGFLVNASVTGGSDCGGRDGGCLPSVDLTVRGNRFSALHGNGSPSAANAFIGVSDGEHVGFSASNNRYCSSDGTTARFLWRTQSTFIDFATWKAMSGTDATSTVLGPTDPACQ